MESMQGNVAVITGGSRGIGLAIARKMGKAGARVVINGRNGEQLQKAEEMLRAEGIEVLGIQADISSLPEVEDLMAQVKEHWGSLHILVNNAAVTKDQLFMRMKPEDWDYVMDINLKGVFYCCKAAIRPMLRNKWGRIINISSVSGLMGNPGQANYAAAKAGLTGFTKTLARELGSRNITANVLAPGFIKTDMTEGLSTEIKEKMLQAIPLGRFGEPDEVANIAAFLASEDAAYITGQIIVIDGGMTM